MSGTRLCGILLTLLGVVCVSAFAQQTGEIRGLITDDTNSPLPGVAITARSPSLQGFRSAVSDKTGSFRLPLLPVGRYDLTFELPGFEKLTLTGNDVRLGFTASIAVSLKPAKLAEEVTVNAPNPPIDKTRADNSFRLNEEELARLPAQSRTIEEIISFTPGVTGVRASTFDGTGTGAPSFRGQGEAGNNWLVDGLSMKGVNDNSLAVQPNYDAWEEVEIVSDGIAPELGQAQGGFINIVTKSGGNEFHGEAGAFVRDWHLRADRRPQLSVASVPDTSLHDFFGNIGGPVVKDKFWFFLSDNFHRTLDDSQEQSIGWLTIPAGRRRFNTNNVFGKLTFTPHKNHTLSLGGTWDEFLNQAGGIGVPETYEKTTYRNSDFRLNYRAILSNDFYLTAALGQYRRNTITEPTDGDFGPPSYFWEDIAQWTNNSNMRYSIIEKRTGFSLDLTRYLDIDRWGSHELRAGLFFNVNDTSSRFEFTGRDFDPWPENGFSNGASIAWVSPGSPFSLMEFGPSAYENSSRGYGFYLRDSFVLGRLSFLLGLRAETQSVYDAEGDKIWTWGLEDFLSPRASVSFDILGDGKNVLKFSLGRFVNPISIGTLWIFNTTPGQQFRQYLWQGPSEATSEQLGDASNWFFVFEQGSSIPCNLDPGLKPDGTTKYLLEFDRQIGTAWALKLRGVWSTSKDLVEDLILYDPTVEGSLRWEYANFELKRRDYKAIEVELDGEFSDRITVNASYTWSQAKGTNPGQGERSSWTSNWGSGYEMGIFGDRPGIPEGAPEKELYDYLYAGLGGRGVGDEGWYGFLPYSIDHMAKLLVVYRAPLGIALSLGGEFLSGYHWEKRGLIPGYGMYSAFIEGRGARTTPAHAYFDLAAEKDFSLGGGTALGLGLNVYNLLNSQRPISYVQEDIDLFGQVWGRQLPCWLQVKVTLRF